MLVSRYVCLCFTLRCHQQRGKCVRSVAAIENEEYFIVMWCRHDEIDYDPLRWDYLRQIRINPGARGPDNPVQNGCIYCRLKYSKKYSNITRRHVKISTQTHRAWSKMSQFHGVLRNSWIMLDHLDPKIFVRVMPCYAMLLMSQCFRFSAGGKMPSSAWACCLDAWSRCNSRAIPYHLNVRGGLRLHGDDPGVFDHFCFCVLNLLDILPCMLWIVVAFVLMFFDVVSSRGILWGSTVTVAHVLQMWWQLSEANCHKVHPPDCAWADEEVWMIPLDPGTLQGFTVPCYSEELLRE